MAESQLLKKPGILCLHGFRTSGEILKKMIGKWPATVLERFDFDFPDAPFPARGKSDIEGLQVECLDFDDCIAYIEDYMIKHGPFDGLLGSSQVGMLASVIPWMQSEGVAFTKVPKIKFLIIISGFILQELKNGPPKLLVNAFSVPVECPSLHLIGDKDFLKEIGLKLLKSFVNPFVILHSLGHTVPKLDEKGYKTMLKFIDRVLEMVLLDQLIVLRPKAAL